MVWRFPQSVQAHAQGISRKAVACANQSTVTCCTLLQLPHWRINSRLIWLKKLLWIGSVPSWDYDRLFDCKTHVLVVAHYVNVNCYDELQIWALIWGQWIQAVIHSPFCIILLAKSWQIIRNRAPERHRIRGWSQRDHSSLSEARLAMFDLLLARMTYGYLVIYADPRQRIRSVGLLCERL